MDPISWIKIGAFFKKVGTSKWLYIFLAVLAIGGGIYFTLNHWKNQAVTSAVVGADTNATVKTLETSTAVTEANKPVDQKFDALRNQTTKDYTNVRARLNTTPAPDADAPASPLLIGTLNDLDRLRDARNAVAVPDPDVPVG